jgi:hypothetical protein
MQGQSITAECTVVLSKRKLVLANSTLQMQRILEGINQGF